MSDEDAKRARGSVAVRIAGHEYKIRSDGDAAALHEIAGYVDRAMARVRERTGTVDSLDVAVLTCLNLAREILALRGQRNAAVDDGRMRSLIDRVEAILGESTRVPQSASDRQDDSASASAAKAAAEAAANAATGAVPSDDNPSEAAPAEVARTLDLPSVEAMRERAASGRLQDSAGEGAGLDAHSALPEARVASGGRERSS